MSRNGIFVRQSDGRVEVRLNDFGRAFVRERFQRLVDAQDESTDSWRTTFDQSIDPSREDDDPLWSLERQKAMASNAELSLITADEQMLSEGESWAWLSSLQHILRATAADFGIVDYITLDDVSAEELEEIGSLQQLLADLADALS